MKTLFLFLLLSSLATCAFSQDDDVYFSPQPKYKKGSSKVIIKTGKSKSDNFLFCQQFLSNIEIPTQASETTFIVKTDELNTRKRQYPYYLNFFCKDSMIIVTGKFKVGITVQIYGVRSEDNYEPIQFKGGKGSAYEITFSEMIALVEKFGYKINVQ